MEMSSTQARKHLQNVTVGDFKFEGANSLIHPYTWDHLYKMKRECGQTFTPKL